MKDNHLLQKKPAWEKMQPAEREIAEKFSNRYINFLSQCKTEREAIHWLKSDIKNSDQYHLSEFSSKAIALTKFGKLPVEKGINIIIAHVDAPRLDLKPSPLVEESELAFLKTHYYGGIKKYHWLNRPLALHGYMILSNGKSLQFTIGEKDDDPVFTIADLLPHLSKKVQSDKKISEAIPGEKLNILVGSLKSESNDKTNENLVKSAILKLLFEKYNITEEDFISAECEVVPAGPAREIGLDRSMVGGYGQDDRICAWCAYQALMNTSELQKTAMVVWIDKEEIGSAGNTGADSVLISDAILQVLKKSHSPASYDLLRTTIQNSFCISADVACAENPFNPEVLDKNNSAKLGYGVTIVKYTGVRGKSGANDAHAELMGKLRLIFNSQKVVWQCGELGRVDEGGGGTVAKYIAHWGIPTIDCGTPIISMHSPFEISHKADIYQTVKGYQAFFEQEEN